MSKFYENVLRYKSHRDKPLWKLLGSSNSYQIIALLQDVLDGDERQVPSSLFVDRVNLRLEDLRAAGDYFPSSVKDYIGEWLRDGWLMRRFPEGAKEEYYELSAEASSAIRIITSIAHPRAFATESRLSIVTSQIEQLVEETDTNTSTRLDKLLEERNRLDEAIRNVQEGRMEVLSDDRAMERLQEIMAMSRDIGSDFGRHRENLAQVEREMRRQLIESDKSRAEILEAFFNGIEVIETTDEGKTFMAFWRMLNDPEQSSRLDGFIDDLLRRPFVRKLSKEDRRYLINMKRRMLDEADNVHTGLRSIGRSLKSFVRNREYTLHRRMDSLLNAAKSLALGVADRHGMDTPIDVPLTLSEVAVHSVERLVLKTPKADMSTICMEEAPESSVSMGEITQQILDSEIDIDGLKTHIQNALSSASQITIGMLMEQYPVKQGLGTLMGYLMLATKHGQEFQGQQERVTWQDGSNRQKSASIPKIYFTKEKLRQLKAQ